MNESFKDIFKKDNKSNILEQFQYLKDTENIEIPFIFKLIYINLSKEDLKFNGNLIINPFNGGQKIYKLPEGLEVTGSVYIFNERIKKNPTFKLCKY